MRNKSNYTTKYQYTVLFNTSIIIDAISVMCLLDSAFRHYPTKYHRSHTEHSVVLYVDNIYLCQLKKRNLLEKYPDRSYGATSYIFLLRPRVTCEIKLFQNYFGGLLQLMNILQHVQCCRRNNSEIISELFRRLK